jgi:hypothetical protein
MRKVLVIAGNADADAAMVLLAIDPTRDLGARPRPGGRECRADVDAAADATPEEVSRADFSVRNVVI